MGCTSSKEKEQAAAAAAEKQRKREAATAALNAPKVDPKDFMACKLKGQTIVKEPGSIRGQQFIIEECEDCTIFLLDYSATVSIDDCKNCRIFVGPCESSVFIRTSSHLKLVIAAQQLRTRECHDLDILLYVSAGQPVIESSSAVRLGCFEFNYFGLAEQFAAANLDPWYSEWSNVHDFTAQAGREAWSFLQPAQTRGVDLLPPLEEVKEGLQSLPGFVTPHTWGRRPLPVAAGSPRMLVLLASGAHDLGFELLEQVLGERLAAGAGAGVEGPQAFLIRSRIVNLAAADKDTQNAVLTGEARKAQAAFVDAVVKKGAAAAPVDQKGKHGQLGLELVVPAEQFEATLKLLRDFAQRVGQDKIYLSGHTEAESKGPLEAFFQNAPVM